MSTVPTNSAYDPQPVWELATLYPYQGTWSEEEYLALTDKTNRLIEFVDGDLEFLSMPTEAHQLILLYLFDALRAAVKPGRGMVLFAGLRVKLRTGRIREPDVVFIRSENFAQRGNRYWEAADLAMEVVSDDLESRHRDYDTKVAEYAAAGIPEYWIIDPQEKKITVLALPTGSTTYMEHGVFRSGDTATSKLLGDFVVDVEAVFAAANV